MTLILSCLLQVLYILTALTGAASCWRAGRCHEEGIRFYETDSLLMSALLYDMGPESKTNLPGYPELGCPM